jgi:tricorn protease
MTTGYPRFPAIHGDTIVFVAEDDLWRVSASGGTATRLTAGVAAASHPRISPDGDWIAYAGAEEGPTEVHVVPAVGGRSRRLTFDGGFSCQVAAWSPEGDAVLYASNVDGPTGAEMRLRSVSPTGGQIAVLPYGRASSISYGAAGVTVIGREYWKDAAHWKRYRGGTAGQLWIDRRGDGQFDKLIKLDGNLNRPHIIADRVYFLSDHEGYGNVYSCDFAGNDLRRHTDHDDFYARGLSGDGHRLVYHCGGRLFLLDPGEEHSTELDITTPVTRTQLARRFVDAQEYLHSVDLSPDGSHLAITSRGKAFSFGNWEGPITQHGESDGVRYRLLTWLHDGKRLVAAAGDAGPAEVLVGLHADGTVPPCRMDQLDIGRVVELVASPCEAKLALANHRGELLLINVDGDAATSTVLDSGHFGEISDMVFSPNGEWLAYACPDSMAEVDSDSRSVIKLAELATGQTHQVTDRVLGDFGPSFDPDGKYLYFIGRREFNPVYDSLHFDLGFPNGSRPYAVALRRDVAAPFVAQPKPLHDDAPAATDTAAADQQPEPTTGPAAPEAGAQTTQPASTGIELDGIANRVVPLPVPDGRYSQVIGVSGKVLVLSHPVTSSAEIYSDDSGGDGALDAVDLSNGKVERYADGVDGLGLSHDAKTLLYRSGDALRVIKCTEKAPDTSEYNRESGWIDLTRVKISVRPELEWPQMFREAWRLISEHFWTEDMSGVDWDAVYKRYAPLVDQISTRGELSDLIWEMNGELGTSHAYESRGDYRPGPHYGQGYLGAEFSRDETGHYRLDKIYTGDVWRPEATSPLHRPGNDIQIGDLLLAVNGQPVGGPDTDAATPAQRLVNLAGQEVRLTLRRGEAAPHFAAVKALSDESGLRYRDWVEENRRIVHEVSQGKVGYIHIPDMAPAGYAEFHRGYLVEYDRAALLVDVRNNGGGHVSGLIIEKLARRRLGYDYSRWRAPVPHPVESPRGVLVTLTNELAGSDGDIFSQSFRQLGLGPLVGTRTWGGVIGYTERPGLSDNTFLSQPEFAFHFDDSKWGVENYGVDPDIEVDYPPQDFATGRDPQLAAGIAEALRLLAEKPAEQSVPADRPRLSPPALPPRPQSR